MEKFLEVAATVVITLIALWGKDIATKATIRHKVMVLEDTMKVVRQEWNDDLKELRTVVAKLEDTLSKTNQGLAGLNATVKGLSNWIERTEDRINKL